MSVDEDDASVLLSISTFDWWGGRVRAPRGRNDDSPREGVARRPTEDEVGLSPGRSWLLPPEVLTGPGGFILGGWPCASFFFGAADRALIGVCVALPQIFSPRPACF